MKNIDLKSILRGIAAEHDGVLNPEDVVEYARPKSSPIHSRFTWDDTEAAKQYRLWQARQLISVVVDYVKTDKPKPIEVRTFMSLPNDRKNGGGYREITAILANPDHRQQMLVDALVELGVFEKKYQTVKELEEVFQSARKVSERARSTKVPPIAA